MELFGDFSRVLLSILFEALPFVLLGSLVSGIMEVFIPSEVLTRILPKNRFLATLSGALAGLALPSAAATMKHTWIDKSAFTRHNIIK